MRCYCSCTVILYFHLAHVPVWWILFLQTSSHILVLCDVFFFYFYSNLDQLRLQVTLLVVPTQMQVVMPPLSKYGFSYNSKDNHSRLFQGIYLWYISIAYIMYSHSILELFVTVLFTRAIFLYIPTLSWLIMSYYLLLLCIICQNNASLSLFISFCFYFYFLFWLPRDSGDKSLHTTLWIGE